MSGFPNQLEMSGFLEMIEDLAGEFQMSRTEAILAPSFSMWIENRSGMDLSWICSLNFVFHSVIEKKAIFSFRILTGGALE